MKIGKEYQPELCVSKDETRPLLRHPWLDVDAKKLYTTDGHRMTVIPVTPDEGDTSGQVNAEAFALARRASLRTSEEVSVYANGTVSAAGMTMPRVDHQISPPPFNQYEIVQKDREPKAVLHLNAKYLYELSKALGADKQSSVRIEFHGDLDPLTVRCERDGAFGVLMPQKPWKSEGGAK